MLLLASTVGVEAMASQSMSLFARRCPCQGEISVNRRRMIMRNELIMMLMIAAVLLGGWSSTYAGDPSLVGWWKLDDGAGTVAAEASSR